MATDTLTAERLREILHYDSESGVFTWKVDCKVGHKTGGQMRVRTGKTAGSPSRVHGYHRICIDRRLYLAHRLAWLYVYGQWPVQMIDHIDGDRANNRIANLRDVSRSMNAQNMRKPPKGKRTGAPLGAHWKKHAKLWSADIQSDGRLVHLGYFRTAEEAHAAYVTAKRRLHEGCTI